MKSYLLIGLITLGFVQISSGDKNPEFKWKKMYVGRFFGDDKSRNVSTLAIFAVEEQRKIEERQFIEHLKAKRAKEAALIKKQESEENAAIEEMKKLADILGSVKDTEAARALSEITSRAKPSDLAQRKRKR